MGELKQSTRSHALLSASGSHRWLNCTPSAVLEDKFLASNKEKESVYAEEGSLAHEFCEIDMHLFAGNIDKKEYARELRKLKKHKLYNPEMDGFVKQYTDFCKEEFADCLKRCGFAELYIEERVDYSSVVPDGFGSLDLGIACDDTLYIIDFKYGMGVSVSAEKNSQLMLYGIGMLDMLDMMFDFKKIKLVVIQPRINNFSVWETTPDKLLDWGNTIVKPAAAKAFAGKGVQKAGDWCKFCKVKAMCATLAAQNVKLARHEFKDPHFLSEEQLIGVYKQIPMLVDWAKAVEEHLTKQCLSGKIVPGYKLVEGKSQRKWTDEKEVRSLLLRNEYKPEDINKTSLLGIPAIEKLLKRDNKAELLAKYIVKPAGKPTMVPASDPRPAINSMEQCKKDFE